MIKQYIGTNKTLIVSLNTNFNTRSKEKCAMSCLFDLNIKISYFYVK